MTTLIEARGTLKPDGLLFAKAINRFAPPLDGLFKGFIDDPMFAEVLRRDLAEDQHPSGPDRDEHFTTTYPHRPAHLESEIREAGFRQLGLCIGQGPGWLAADLSNRMSDPDRKPLPLDLIRAVEQERGLFGVSSHFVADATK